jgi:hypothetical protein
MENINNWFKIIIAVAVLIIACSIGYYFITIPRTATIQTNDIDSQAKCATQAQKVLDNFEKKYINDGWSSADGGVPASTRVNFNQQNHYNQTLNKCFILITYDFTQAGLGNPKFTGNGETLFDAYQNDELASCVHADREAYSNFNAQHTDTCLIGLGNGLSSNEQYKNFVNQKMELNQ